MPPAFHITEYEYSSCCLGWGKLSEFPYHSAMVLMQLQVPVVNNLVCRGLYFWNSGFQTIYDKTIRNSVICAGFDKGKGVWKGDSGKYYY